jgi:hypothetical protein
VPVHQPPDHEGDKDQPEYAADPDRPTLTVIAAAVEPKPTSKENHEQHDDQNQFHRFVFHQVLSAIRAERQLAAFTRADRPGCRAATEAKVPKV